MRERTSAGGRTRDLAPRGAGRPRRGPRSWPERLADVGREILLGMTVGPAAGHRRIRCD